MKIKTSETTPLQLNWLAAKIEGMSKNKLDWYMEWFWDKGREFTKFSPSTDWSQGGPIIERERIDLFTEKGTPESWVASIARYQNGECLVGWRIHKYGPTALIAAMRCYVASKLGDEVDVPEELLGGTNQAAN